MRLPCSSHYEIEKEKGKGHFKWGGSVWEALCCPGRDMREGTAGKGGRIDFSSESERCFC